MKMLQIGCGGIGSYLIQEICECINQGQMNDLTSIHIADDDMVELQQISYQNFKKEEVGMNKAYALQKRLESCGVTAIPKRIHEADLKNHDLIILCVDNEKTRQIVIKYCHKHSKEFLDLRATGRRIFAMPKQTKLEDNLKFIDANDTREYSCQDKADLEKGLVQKGNKIVAMIGTQMVLNLLRGHDNKTISMVV